MARRDQRSILTNPSGGYFFHHFYRWMVVWCVCCLRVASAQDCGGVDVGVVVVASVFGTLAVVALVLCIAYFVLRRRNGGALFPKRGQTRSSGRMAEEGNVSNDSCYVNAAFSAHDVMDSEHGRKKSSPQKNQSPGKKSLKTDSQKTWVSLPGCQDDLPSSLHRQGSCGSLDTNYTSTETVSVWLLSQDIIGLGFNISGNMRDGIYVSQVHSRGPAVESGKVQVGDRILSVTIGYENIVYEDALTILSYASPYPVKLTLQKERVAHPNPQSPRKEQLSHPLYRSQSLDTLFRMSRDPPLRPQRTLSEIKLETHRKGERSHKAKALSKSYAGYGYHEPGRGQFEVCSEVLVHSAAGGHSPLSAVPSLESYSATWNPRAGRMSMDNDDDHDDPALEMVTPTHAQMSEHSPTEGRPDDVESQAGRKKSRLDMEAAREFANLMDQVQEAPAKKTSADDVTRAETAPKTAPSKPERKKKPSNASTVSSDESLEGVVDVDSVDDTFQSKGSAEAEASSTERVSPSPDGFVSVSLSDRTLPPEGHEEELVEAAEASKAHAERPTSASKGRDRSRESRPKENKKKKEDKKPVLTDEELERLIAMNSFAPGSQGWAGIQAGGRQGGVHDDFAPRDLLQQTLQLQTQAAASARRGSSSSEASSQSHARQRGGVAFEVREDVMTGRPVSVDISRSRNSSASPSRSGSRDRMPRVSSMLDAPKQQGENKENGEEGLGWSGKRLVRAGSFSQIPQDDSLNDWTDKRPTHNYDDDNISTESGKPSTNPGSDSEMDPHPSRGLISRDVFKARENLANMSDLSNSVSSSRSSSPPVPNGPTTTSASSSTTPGGVTYASSSLGNVTGLKNVSADLQPPSTEPSDNNNSSISRTVGVKLNSGTEDDMDC